MQQYSLAIIHAYTKCINRKLFALPNTPTHTNYVQTFKRSGIIISHHVRRYSDRKRTQLFSKMYAMLYDVVRVHEYVSASPSHSLSLYHSFSLMFILMHFAGHVGVRPVRFCSICVRIIAPAPRMRWVLWKYVIIVRAKRCHAISKLSNRHVRACVCVSVCVDVDEDVADGRQTATVHTHTQTQQLLFTKLTRRPALVRPDAWSQVVCVCCVFFLFSCSLPTSVFRTNHGDSWSHGSFVAQCTPRRPTSGGNHINPRILYDMWISHRAHNTINTYDHAHAHEWALRGGGVEKGERVRW